MVKKGILDLDYFVLTENETKAREQFKQVPKNDGSFRALVWSLSFLRRQL